MAFLPTDAPCGVSRPCRPGLILCRRLAGLAGERIPRMGGPAMAWRRLAVVAAALGVLATTTPVHAIVGAAETAAREVAQHLVVIRTRRALCTGAVLASDLVLTAGHCLREAGRIQVRPYGERKTHD